MIYYSNKLIYNIFTDLFLRGSNYSKSNSLELLRNLHPLFYFDLMTYLNSLNLSRAWTFLPIFLGFPCEEALGLLYCRCWFCQEGQSEPLHQKTLAPEEEEPISIIHHRERQIVTRFPTKNWYLTIL